MKFDYTTRLNSSMSAATLNSTVLASMAELCAVLDGATKPDHTNFHPMARFKAGQFGTIDGDRISLAADGLGIPTVAIKDGAVTATPMNSTTVSDRAVETTLGSRGVRTLSLSAKSVILRGQVTVTVAGGSATGSVTVNWDSDAAPTVSENRPVGWTSPLKNIHVFCCPSSTWFRGAGPTYQLAAWRITGAPTDTGFTVEVHDYSWDTGTHASSDYTTGSRTFKLYWFATANYS